jgi:DNA-binding helix-hairpin-helix protein with protein kinase domain
VIGDINHSGILISRKATVALIDADSFQVLDGNQRYLCRVGVPEYTPPELQGLNLGTVVRTPNHDAFGLAIVIFQLLAMGRHPFVGSYAKGDLPLHRAIAEYRFAYSKQRHVGITPPPGTVSLDDFLSPVARAFEATFSPAQQERPTAPQWVTLLEEYERSLRVCTNSKLHYYSSAASSCPWCRMEGRLGIVLFVPVYTSYIGSTPVFDPGSGGFDLLKVWALIEAVRLPDRSRLMPILPQQTPQPSAEARAAKLKRDGLVAVSYLSFVAAAVLLFTVPQLMIFAIGLVILGFVLRARQVDISSSLRQKFFLTESEWDQALQGWERRCGLDRIEALKTSLVEARAYLQELGREEADRIAQYQAQRRERQLKDFLDSFHIRRVKIHGIGPAKEATLASYGIETAADVDQARVLAVPGFGPVNSRPLLEWRKEVERKFNYNPNPTPSDQAAINKIRADIAQEAVRLRQHLSSGAVELRQAVLACEQMLKVPDPLLVKIEAARSEINADFAYLGIPLPPCPTPAHRSTPPRQPAFHRSQTTTRTAPTSTRTSTHASSSLPSCPICGRQMVRRTAKRGRRRGRQFWGCSRYPVCNGTRA